jgi:hypothetical protein
MNVSEAVPTEKKDGYRGVRDTGKQPEPFVVQGSNENRGYPQAGIPVGIGKTNQRQVIPRQDCP